MTITEYLATIGFTRVEQSDSEGRFLDPDFLECEGLFAELHDDNHFYLWVNPIISTVITDTNLMQVKLKCVNVLATYRTLTSVKH
jgi:hypothetical protein